MADCGFCLSNHKIKAVLGAAAVLYFVYGLGQRSAEQEFIEYRQQQALHAAQMQTDMQRKIVEAQSQVAHDREVIKWRTKVIRERVAAYASPKQANGSDCALNAYGLSLWNDASSARDP